MWTTPPPPARLARGADRARPAVDSGFGAIVYRAAIALALFLEQRRELVAGRRVLELGAGTGFLSLVAAHLGAERVLCTDGDPDVVALSAENVRANADALRAGVVQCVPYLWSAEPAVDDAGARARPDLVLAADVAAVPYREAFEGLLSTLRTHVSGGARGLLAYQRRHHEEDAFFERLAEVLAVREVARADLPGDFQDSDIRLYWLDPLAKPN